MRRRYDEFGRVSSDSMANKVDVEVTLDLDQIYPLRREFRAGPKSHNFVPVAQQFPSSAHKY
jgi:hypothetical protein